MSLVRKRAAVKASLTKADTSLKDLKTQQNLSANLISAKLQLLEKCYDNFLNIQNQIVEAVTDDNLVEAEATEQEEFENKYISVKIGLEELLNSIRVTSSVPPSAASSSSAISNTSTSNHQTVAVNLPRINLPSFSGNSLEWTSFYDLFVALVHNCPSLSKVQKLQYLKSSLKGQASQLIASIQITEANYDEAWDILLERYENKRLIINSHLHSLFFLSLISNESAMELRRLIDSATESIRSLSVLGLPIEHWDTILIYILAEKLSPTSRQQWELSAKDSPTFEEFKIFINTRCKAMEAAQQTKSTKVKVSQPFTSKSINPKSQSSHHASSEINNCTICGDNHSIFKCEKLKSTPPSQQLSLIKQLRLCFNCLHSGHGLSSCGSTYSCKVCKRRHHTLLHDAMQLNSSKVSENSSTSSVGKNTNSHYNSDRNTTVLLSTVQVKVKDANGKLIQCRALLDNGSQPNLATQSLVRRLQMQTKGGRVPISTSAGSTYANGQVTLSISSINSKFQTEINAIVLPKLTGILPSARVDSTQIKYIHSLHLADPTFCSPGPVDLILGADIFNLVYEGEKILGEKGHPTAHRTIFGWILSGSCRQETPTKSSLSTNSYHCTLDDQLRKFWEVEEIQSKPLHTVEEKKCLNHYTNTYSRDSSGRYIARLPFRDDIMPLGESRQQALNRLHYMEKKLSHSPSLHTQYTEFMEEYLKMGHMEEIKSSEEIKPPQLTYYLPHHSVLKEDSTTTKLRVVFDASAKSSSGHSLNSKLLVGPTVQPDLLSILIRFRQHRIAFTSDIAKMYRQVKIHPEDQDYQRILWRNKPSDVVKDFRLKTVTYGTAAAPFLATQTLNQLAQDESSQYPEAAVALQRDFYVDDCMSGEDDLEAALHLQAQLISITNAGGFPLRKWASNSTQILAAIPEEYREVKLPFSINFDDSVKALGLRWHPATDEFSFTVSLPPSSSVTKRTILSDVSRLFDPLGLLSPTILLAKIFLRQLWQEGVDWDQPPPPPLTQTWLDYRKELAQISTLRIPRHMGTTKTNTQLELHGFADASEVAFGACIYIRVIQEDIISITLLCSKTRVAPLKTISLPRLELCAAVLLTRLFKFLISTLNLEINSLFAWSDSTVALCWIRGQPSRWKTFVANRVTEVQETLSPSLWHHVSSGDNPADTASRGQVPTDLINNHQWWHGPSWLLSSHPLPTNTFTEKEDSSQLALKEEKKTSVNTHTISFNYSALFFQYSTLNKLVRITALLFRFATNCRCSKDQRKTSFISTDELHFSLTHWIKMVQEASFQDEYKALTKEKPVAKSSQLIKLSPFLDNGLIRIGGRLEHSQLSFTQKHPILLPRSHHLVDLIVTHHHLRLLHAGATLLLSHLHLQFWILGSRSTIRRIIHKCVICTRDKARTMDQLMGQLPPPRTTQSLPFQHSGLDYGGPFSIKTRHGRGKIPITKSYLFLFVCLATRAVHLELVSDLTTSAFIAALHRFISRRSRPAHIYSDCGTNFVGANNELTAVYHFIKSQQKDIGSFFASEGIRWHFNPPSAPHFGGLWEAAIKSSKTHLRRVIGHQTLTFEEMSTLLTQVEACLNSRPLCAISSDNSELDVLTPAHFLVGSSLQSLPEQDLTLSNLNHLSRWKQIQAMLQHFWRKWTTDYLNTLQQKSKWTKEKENIKLNSIVIVKDENAPPIKWHLARVIKLHPGQDGLIRSVTIKTANGEIQRPIVKLCPLPVDLHTPIHNDMESAASINSSKA